MRYGYPIVLAALFTTGLAALPGSANAVPVNCPGTLVTTDREFTLDTAIASTCLGYGLGPFAGTGYSFLQSKGLSLLDKVDGDKDDSGLFDGALAIAGLGSTSGSFSISSDVWSMFEYIVFTMQPGMGRPDDSTTNPDWAAFLLAPTTVDGNWSVAPNKAGALSNATIWGKRKVEVPEPTPLALLGAGLIALAFARSRKRSS